MAKRRKTMAELKRTARWEQIVSAYQRRHRQWVMECMPTMNPADWGQYTQWVAGFGAMSPGQAYRNSRKMRRGLTAIKNTPVTATVRTPLFAPAAYEATHQQFVWGARRAGKVAAVRRATRR